MLTELADKAAWMQHAYFKTFDSFWKFEDNVDRIEESEMSSQEFVKKYEKPYKPVIIRGVQKDWKAQHKWTIEVFLKSVSLLENYIKSYLIIIIRNRDLKKSR